MQDPYALLRFLINLLDSDSKKLSKKINGGKNYTMKT